MAQSVSIFQPFSPVREIVNHLNSNWPSDESNARGTANLTTSARYLCTFFHSSLIPVS